ncbi:MAG: putative iron-regulated protein [Saprospiraceae bacterium]|jgi:putative iron-regulated protein
MKKVLFGFLAISLLFSCSSDDEPIIIVDDYSNILTNIGNNVILKTYENLAAAGSALQVATQNLGNNPSATNLELAKQAWITARSPWEQSEGFLFGPVDQEGLDPSLDSWPVNVTDLNNVLASDNTLSVAFLAQQEGTLKGFHTVEFLLWGENSDKQVGDFSEREFEYLAATTETLAEDTEQLYALWNPADGNYIDNILTAGNGSAVYISQKSALEEITNALIIIVDEVANGKINDPLAQQDLTLEESRFSANSKADFADNMRSIGNIYNGTFGSFGNGQSLAEIIKAKDADLDQKLITEISAAIQSIEDIPGTFSDAVINNAAIVTDAQFAVRTLQATLEQDILPIISNL